MGVGFVGDSSFANPPTPPPAYPWGTLLLVTAISFVIGANVGYSFFEKHGTT